MAHCCINVCLYGLGTRPYKRWTMTERGAGQASRSARHFAVGPSSLQWDGESLRIDLDEVAAPWPRRVRGRIRLQPHWLSPQRFALDAAQRHVWGPIAPSGQIEVALDQPALSWRGHAYLDSNAGLEPLNQAQPPFAYWDWSRAALADGRCAVLYDIPHAAKGVPPTLLAKVFAADGSVTDFEPPQRHAMPPTAWRMARGLCSEATPQVQHTLEDTPFYSRSVVRSRLLGEEVTSLHESFSGQRLASLAVQGMLPFKMPRVA
jgi:carotenoid 1,2-hydratase